LTELCTFSIAITNIGDAPFTGDLHLTDSVGPGTPVRILKGGGSGTCDEAQNTQGAGGFAINSIKCDIGPFPEGIRPNDTVRLEVLVEAGRGWGSNKNLNNCAELSSDSDMGPAETAKKDCADVKLDPFDVDVAKTGDQSCQPGGECRFDIDIFNPNNSVTHDDPVTVTDKLTGLSSAQIVSITKVSGNNAFPCKPAPTQIPFSCTGKMHIEPKEENHYTMIVRLPADASAASFSNCATVGGARSSGETSDASCHSVQLAPPEQQPFSLKIDKTGPESCAPGSECAFDLTLTNSGNKDHTGPVTLTDGLSGGVPSMSIASIEPPLPCTTQPAEIPFNCKTGDDFTLPAGGKRTFKVTARVPRSAETFTNCAILAGGKAPRSGAPGADAPTACHTVKVASPGAAPTPRTCSGGMVLIDGDVCACPGGTQWNGRACAATPTPGNGGTDGVKINVCEGDRPIGTFPNCCPRGTRFKDGACVRIVAPPPACEGDRPIGIFPNCCPVGTFFKDGACRTGTGGTNTNKGDDTQPKPPPVCKGDRPIGTPPNCCPVGTFFKDGACRRRGVDTTPPVCKGDRPIGTPPNCCPVGTFFKDGACRTGTGGATPSKGGDDTRPNTPRPPSCPAGTHFERTLKHPLGACVSDTGGTNGNKGDDKCTRGIIGCGPKPNPQPPGKCTGGRIGTPPKCLCPPGTHETRSGQCETNAKPTPKPAPTPTPTPTGPSPKKQCSGGKVPRSGDGACVCPSGTTDRGGKCVDVVK
jgi:hypothetical protein